MSANSQTPHASANPSNMVRFWDPDLNEPRQQTRSKSQKKILRRVQVEPYCSSYSMIPMNQMRSTNRSLHVFSCKLEPQVLPQPIHVGHVCACAPHFNVKFWQAIIIWIWKISALNREKFKNSYNKARELPLSYKGASFCPSTTDKSRLFLLSCWCCSNF